MSQLNIVQMMAESERYLRERISVFPPIVVVTGSGLGGLVASVEKEIVIPYAQIPHFRCSTVSGHQGELVVGKVGGNRVAFMHGRLHYYEGYSMQEVVFPFRVLAASGTNIFLLTNAAGSLHVGLKPPDLVLVTDHINLMGTNPLVGENYDELGVRFPDMTHLYDPQLNDCLRTHARRLGMILKEGIYVGLHGPSYETPAEIRMYRTLGGDLVGMSTVPEAIAIHHMGKKVVAISCVTNFAAGVSQGTLVHDEVLRSARAAYGDFSNLIREFVKAIDR